MTPEVKAVIIGLHRQGNKDEAIAGLLGISVEKVINVIWEYFSKYPERFEIATT